MNLSIFNHRFKKTSINNNAKQSLANLHAVVSKKQIQRTIKAAVVVCNSWSSFENEMEIRRWVRKFIRRSLPEDNISPQLQIQAIFGHRGEKLNTRMNMLELLTRSMQSDNRLQTTFQTSWIEICNEDESAVMCVVAWQEEPIHQINF